MITAEYRKLNAALHASNQAYGTSGVKHAQEVVRLRARLNTHSVLDYGCGKGTLAAALPFPIWEYDPAIVGKDRAPVARDLVVCTDVLEHIEPELIDVVLADLARCTRKLGFFMIHIGPAMKVLADGRNAHLIQEPPEWWLGRLKTLFVVERHILSGVELYCWLLPKTLHLKDVSEIRD